MSAFLAVRTNDRVHLMADAAHYRPDGTLIEIASKLRTFGRFPGAMTARGEMVLLDHFMFIAGHVESFDVLALTLPAMADMMETALRPRMGETVTHYEFCLAGWSESRARAESYIFCGHDLDENAPARQLVALGDVTGAGSQPSDATLAAAGWRDPPTLAEFDPGTHGAAYFEALRRTPGTIHKVAGNARGYGVGGYAECATVTAAGITREIVRIWPDRVGHKIDPFAPPAEDRGLRTRGKAARAPVASVG